MGSCARRTIDDWEELRVWELVYGFRWKPQDAYRQLITKVVGLDDNEPLFIVVVDNYQWHMAAQLNFVTMDIRCTIPLFCWILNLSHSPFPVDIDDSRTVGHLKEEILAKKSNMFANIEADQLKLWKVSSTFSFGHTMLITMS